MVKTRSGLDTHDAASVTAWHRLAGDRPGMQRKTTKAAKARHTQNRGQGRGPSLPPCRFRQQSAAGGKAPRAQLKATPPTSS